MRRIKKHIAFWIIWVFFAQSFAPGVYATHHNGLTHVTATNISVQDITRTNATICYTLSGNGNAKVYYGQTIAYGQTFQEEAASSCGKIFRLTGLSGGAAYNFKLVSWPSGGNEADDGESSANQTFSTPAGDTIAPGNVADGKANLGSAASTSSTYNSVSFNWKVPGDDGWNSGAGPSTYVVKFQKRGGTLFQGPSDGGFWNAAQNVPLGNLTYAPTLPGPQMGVAQTLTISGLEASTQYRFGVLSIDAAGNQSTVPGIWDLDTVAAPATDTFAPPPVTFLTATSTAQTSVGLWWIAPWDPGVNSVPQPAARYEVRYRAFSNIQAESDWQASTAVPNTPTPKAGGQQENFSITGLTPNTTYYFAVRAFDAAGNFSNLTVLSASTLPLPPVDSTPPKLTNFHPEFITKTSADIVFTLDEDATVRVEYSVPGGILLSRESSFSGSSTLTNAKIFLTGLLPGTYYQYKIIARNTVNLSTTEGLLGFTTLSDTGTTTPPTIPTPAPSAPLVTHARVTDISSTSARIEAASDQTGSMRIEYGTSAQYGNFTPWASLAMPSYQTTPGLNATSTYSSVTVSGLTPDTIFYGRLHVKNTQEVASASVTTFQWKTLPTSYVPPANPPQLPLNSTLASGGAGLVVLVKSPEGNPVNGATVGLSEKNSPYRWASGTTNASGEYTFPKTIAGEYNLGVGSTYQRSDLEGVSIKVNPIDGTTINQYVTLPKRSTPTPLPVEPLYIYNVSPGSQGDDASSLYIGWSTNKPSTSKVEYGITAAMVEVQTDSAYTTNHSILLKGLDPKMTLYFKVSSIDSQGSSAYSTQYTYTFTPAIKTYFTLNYQNTYPSPGSQGVPITTSQLHVEFSRTIDAASVSQSSIDARALGDPRPLPGAMVMFNNGFDYKLFEPLKSNTAYSVTIRGVIRDTSNTPLDHDYTYTFTTAGGDVVGIGVIKGIVKDSSGNPIPGASVSLSNANYSSTRLEYATQFGEFTFVNLKPDTYILTVYPPKTHSWLTTPQPTTIAVAANETKIQDITLTSSRFIVKGTVLFGDKTPVADAEVVAYRKDGPGSASAEVNALGEYCMVVSPGVWVLSVQPRYTYIQPYSYASSYRAPQKSPCSPAQLAQKNQVLHTAQVVQPSSSAFAQVSPTSGLPMQVPFHGNWYWKQAPQEVVVGDPSQPMRIVHFEVTKVTVTRMSGRVVRSDGLSLSPGAVSLRLLGSSDTRQIYVPVSADGKFESAVAPGTYKVVVETNDPTLTLPDLPPLTIVEGEIKDLGTITLGEATLSIQGKVTTEEGTAIPRIKVGAWKQATSETRFAVTDENGSYILKVSEGDWIVGVAPTSDQQFTITEPPRQVRIEKGKQATLNFTLTINNSLVTGLVKNASGAILSDFFGYVMVRLKGGNAMPIAGTPVERGQFSIRLTKGEYIFALEVPPNAPPISSEPISVSISSGEQKTISFTVNEKRAHIVGRLLNENGAVVTGLPFKVFTAGAYGAWYSADVNTETGTYTLTVPPGQWLMDYEIGQSDEYEKPPFRGMKLSIAQGDEKKVDLKVRKTTSLIKGKTIDSQGEAVPNVWVAVATESFSRFSENTTKDLEYLNGAYTDKNGQFELNVRAGTYYIRSFLPPTFGLANPEEQKVSVKGGKVADVSLVFRPITGTVTGTTVVQGKSGWAYVWAWSDTGGYADTTSESNGVYNLKIAPNDVWHIAALSERNRDTFKSSETVLAVGDRPKITHNIDLVPLNVRLPDPVSVAGEADKLSIASNSEGVKLAVPANAVGEQGNLSLSITPEVLTPSQGTSRVVGFGYDLAVRTTEGRQINSFNSDLTVTMPYNPTEVAKLGLKPSQLALQYWDEIRYSWQPVQNAIINEKDHTITCSVNHLTRFAVVAATKTTPPAAPKVSLKISKKGITFGWNLGKDVSKIKYVKLYRSAQKGALGNVVLNNIKKNNVTDSRVKSGKQYYYTIRTVDVFGNESINTKQVSATAL